MDKIIKQSLCSIRRNKLIDNSTQSEITFKNKLDKLNIKYCYQKGFIAGDNFCIVDFYLPKPYKLCIEIDGGYHNTPIQIRRDKSRTKYLINRGFKVLRLTNREANSIPLVDLKQLIDKYTYNNY